MLETKEVEIGLKSQTIKYYEDLGYKIPRRIDKYGKLTMPKGSKIFVKIEDLTDCSNAYVNYKCDSCGEIHTVTWGNYKRYVKGDGKIYCINCAKKLYGGENIRQARLKNGQSFKMWCIENNRQDVLNRWDYELNNYKPDEINQGTHKKYYFKCPRGLHKSELKIIVEFTSGKEGSIQCKKCNSFAQWGIDNVCEDFLEKYWDYKLNEVDPWKISKGTPAKKVWIKCQNKEYHDSYHVACNNFINNSRCPYCLNHNGAVHPLDSLGALLEGNGLLNIWSDKNKKTPYEFSPNSGKEAWWRCPDGIHEEFYRGIHNSNARNFRCPECQHSKGEQRVSQYLTNNNINYIAQKEYNGLIGLRNGNLSYDFYLPQYNLLIEYQGEQHEKYTKGMHKSKKDFERQQEHDRRKHEYAQDNNINFLEIWYYDFNNVEEILDKYFMKSKLNKVV